MEEKLISISEMAQLCGISRQTLILYDSLDLFKPVHVSEAGYRKYSVYQIPYLREICLLKELGIPLKEIKEHMTGRDSEAICGTLRDMDQKLEKQMNELRRKRLFIRQRMERMDHFEVKLSNVRRPYFEWRAEEKAILVPFEKEHVDREHLHLTLMKAWRILLKHDMIASKGFGSLIGHDVNRQGSVLYPIGSFISVPFPEEVEGLEFRTIPEGNYAAMYKYGMPYDLEAAQYLINWVHEQGYEVCGDIIDQCLLDTTFYDEEHSEDFCLLLVPVHKMKNK